MVRKTISLPEEQAKWIDDHTINLSRFVQKRLQEEIDFEQGI